MQLMFGIPIIGSIILLILKNDTVEDKIRIKKWGLLVSIGTLIETIRLWIGTSESTAEFQYVSKLAWYDNIQITFGIDGISILFIVLTAILIPICLIASWDSIKFQEKEYILSYLIMEIILFGVFTVLDILGFYICFEAVVIPMFLIIGIWGGREEKITAAYYFFFYTILGSVLFLISILYIYQLAGTTDYESILGLHIDPTIQNLLFLGFFASLAVKIPKFPFHIWLPLAHVEAPLGGSIILAGILIKLGSYGFIRYTLPILPDATIYFTPLVYTLGILGIVYASLTTMRQTDLKRIIAYSSIGHMAVIMLGTFSLTIIGLEGSIFLQIGHAVVSSALFIVVTILYERYHTRTVKYYRGVAITMPLFAGIFCIFTLGNIGMPLTSNFIGEILSLIGTYEDNAIIAVIGSLGMILSAGYSLLLFNRVSYGIMSPYIQSAKENRDITRREFYVLLPLILLMIILGIYPNLILNYIHAPIVNILSYIKI